MSRSELHDWECAIERLCGDKTMMKYKMLVIAQDIYDTAFVRGKNYMSLEQTRNDVLDKIRTEIENHCGLAKESHCRYCSYCNSLMGVREILETIDKYKTESENKK